jgi:hypothetical protein
LMVDRSQAAGEAERLVLDAATIRRDIGAGWLLAYCAEGVMEINDRRAAAGEVLKLGSGRHGITGRGLALVMMVHMLPGQ